MNDDWLAKLRAKERAREEARHERQARLTDLPRRRGETAALQGEREAEHKLGLRLIDIGWRALAKELLGGSPDTMVRLNRVRKRLQRWA